MIPLLDQTNQIGVMPLLSDSDSSYSGLKSKAFWGLCAFSVLNPAVTQAGMYFLPSGIAGYSPMQLFQGVYLVVILATLPLICRDATSLSRQFKWLTILFTAGLCAIHVRIWAMGRTPSYLATAERIVCLRIVMSCLLWYYVSLLVSSPKHALRLMNSLILGGSVCAVWILFFYFRQGGGVAAYAASGVEASFGSEGVSGKAVAGLLLSSAVGMMYMAIRNASGFRAVGVLLLLGALFVTFDRSAQVAVGCVALWSVIWWQRSCRPRSAMRVMTVFLVGLVLCGSVYLIHRGTDELIARWTFDFDRGEVGSGRGAFYTTAWRWFVWDSDLGDFVMGMGFANIHELIFQHTGLAVHCHSDLFDMIVMGGVFGLVLYLLMWGVLASTAMNVPVRSVEFGAMGAMLAAFGVMSLLTGQMNFPLTMYPLGAQLVCMRVLALSSDAACSYEETAGWAPSGAIDSLPAYW